MNIDKSPIGSRLKYKRKALNLTLEEGSEDICSVSYLSKVENNLIRPTYKYLSQLKSKYQMEYEEIDQKIYEDELNLMIEHFFNDEQYKIKDKHHYEDYQEFIRKYASFVMSEQNKKANDMFKDMLLFIPNLPIKSLNFVLALSSKVLYNDLRYSDAKALLCLMNIEESNDMMKMIQHKWLLKNAIKLSQVLLFVKIYPAYKDALIKHQCYKALPEIELERKILYQTISEFNLDGLDQRKSDVKLLIIKSLFQKQQYQKVVDMTRTKMLNPEFLTYHLLSLDKLDKVNEIRDLISQIQIDKQTHKTAWILKRHLMYKYTENKQSQLAYLRNEILGYKHLTDEINILYYLMIDSFEMFQKLHFYKEATETINKYLPMIRQLNYN